MTIFNMTHTVPLHGRDRQTALLTAPMPGARPWRRGQVPEPRSGAPKAQGLTAAIAVAEPSSVPSIAPDDPISLTSTGTDMPMQASTTPQIYTSLTDVTAAADQPAPTRGRQRCNARAAAGRWCRSATSPRGKGAVSALRSQVASPWPRPIRSCRGAHRRRGDARTLDGRDPDSAARTSHSASKAAGLDLRRPMRRSQSPASRRTANHPVAMEVNRDASHSCIGPGSGVIAQRARAALGGWSGTVVPRRAWCAGGPAQRSHRRNRSGHGRSSYRSTPERGIPRT
jgi:hypothetical protein